MGTTQATSKLVKVQRYFLFFMLCAVIGWVYEVFLEVVVYRWGFSNRGVLFGPYCPIYGVGILTFLLCFHKLLEKKTPTWLRVVKPLLLFVGCTLVATAIELAASYLLEWLTGSWPWMTYADYAIHFQARIALSPSVRFGLGGLLFLYGVYPLFQKGVSKLSDKAIGRMAWVLLGILTVDAAATILCSVL